MHLFHLRVWLHGGHFLKWLGTGIILDGFGGHVRGWCHHRLVWYLRVLFHLLLVRIVMHLVIKRMGLRVIHLLIHHIVIHLKMHPRMGTGMGIHGAV